MFSSLLAKEHQNGSQTLSLFALLSAVPGAASITIDQPLSEELAPGPQQPSGTMQYTWYDLRCSYSNSGMGFYHSGWVECEEDDFDWWAEDDFHFDGPGQWPIHVYDVNNPTIGAGAGGSVSVP